MSTDENLVTLFNELNQEIDKLNTIMQEKARPLIDKAAKIMFDAAPEIKSVYWSQYTPYFMDGDTCYFSVNDIFFILHDDPEIEEDEEYYEEGSQVYTANDLVYLETKLKESLEFNANPDHYRRERRDKDMQLYGREMYGWQTYAPYHDSIEKQENHIAFVKQFITTVDGEKIQKAFDDFTTVLSAVRDEIMELVYGNGVRVIINKDGTDIEEVEHD